MGGTYSYRGVLGLKQILRSNDLQAVRHSLLLHGTEGHRTRTQ